MLLKKLVTINSIKSEVVVIFVFKSNYTVYVLKLLNFNFSYVNNTSCSAVAF